MPKRLNKVGEFGISSNLFKLRFEHSGGTNRRPLYFTIFMTSSCQSMSWFVWMEKVVHSLVVKEGELILDTIENDEM